jgi:peroxiredoxin Q/BCP
MLKEGDVAPDFSLESHDGRVISLHDFLGKRNILLYFYIKDNTPGCAKETCGFRDMFELLEEGNFVVLGISPDSIESHQKFAKEHDLPFPLLSDTGRKVAKAYGALGIMGLLNKRMTFLVGLDGKIIRIIEGIGAGKHIEEVEKKLRKTLD